MRTLESQITFVTWRVSHCHVSQGLVCCGRSVIAWAGEGLVLLVLGAGGRACVSAWARLGVADPLESLLAPDKLAHLAGRLLGAAHPGHLGHGHGHHLPERHLQAGAGAGALLCNCDPPAADTGLWLIPLAAGLGLIPGLSHLARLCCSSVRVMTVSSNVTGYKSVW